jgi:hypothetical protein
MLQGTRQFRQRRLRREWYSNCLCGQCAIERFNIVNRVFETDGNTIAWLDAETSHRFRGTLYATP